MVKSNENAIREAAYYNWQNAGCPMGQDEYFWAMAIEQFSNCKSGSCSKSSSASSAKKTSSKTNSSACKATKSAACKTSTSSKKSK